MKINDMNRSKKESTKKALKEHFEVKMNFNKMPLSETKTMLKRVRDLITETRTSKQAHTRHQNPAYMKLIMLEQALTDHYGDLRVQHQIMLENEEVQKSQVILAAQDMIDSIQKMVEQISKMKVEELPAVAVGVTNEIGSNEGTQFEQSVAEALGTLEQALTAAKGAVTSSLGQITGEGGDQEAFSGADQEMGAEEEMGGEELPDLDDMGDEGGEELPELPEPDMEEPEEELGGAGRARR